MEERTRSLINRYWKFCNYNKRAQQLSIQNVILEVMFTLKAITFGEIFYASCLMSLIKEWENWFAPPVVSSSSPVVANIIVTEVYMVVNFRARGISRDACKLTQTLMLIKKIEKLEKVK